MSKKREYEHKLVIDRVILAIHDYGTRPNATRKSVMKSLKDNGFTASEIKEALGHFT